ncbi:hypothetical protein HPB50_017027 [Hyalomma asiaticum]|uniref:Uncharacterized protein n=1 Tax=Hyalomma asiaticum TaxID=266040 RepID=A0ACB7RLC9_HYAAI|nr:hypothetical protein HPB50_017027 [Hyalomma asiaticum]
MAHGGALGMDLVMWIDCCNVYEALQTRIFNTFKIFENAGSLGGWQHDNMICKSRCKMTGSERAFAWHEIHTAFATTYLDFKNLALRRFYNEPASAIHQRLINAKQNPGEEVRSFADRLRVLGTATLRTLRSQDSVKTLLRQEILAEQLSQLTERLGDPVKIFLFPSAEDVQGGCAGSR